MNRLISAIGAREAALIAGLCLMFTGLALVYLPAAFIACGAIITGLAVFGVR